MKLYEYPSPEAEARLEAIINRGLEFKQDDYMGITGILEDVRIKGDEALIQYTNRFDAPDLQASQLAVTPAEFEQAQNAVDPEFMAALERAVKQIRSFHQRQLQNSWIVTERPGTLLGQLVNPVDTAGVYVPGAQGGKTPLVSSVLMGGIPAKIAGVGRVVMTTPPREDGTVNPFLLVAAQTVGMDAVYKIGSAWAIAGLAYGTETVPRCDVIVGPGNMYVTLAKKVVSGTVGIDMIAGPSEILVIADESAIPEFTAADLLSQAEHDPLSSSILLTPSRQTAQAVADAVAEQLKTLNRKEIARAALDAYGGILKVPDLDTAVKLANRIAPEHLELHVAEPFAFMGKIRNAGAVFMGHYTPEPVGDYIAGPNHVLPTAGTARFSSALSVDNFIKKTSVIRYSRAAFQKEAQDIIRLADIEGLDAHAKSVKVRLDRE